MHIWNGQFPHHPSAHKPHSCSQASSQAEAVDFMETADTATVMEAWGESDCGTEIFCLIIVLLNHKAGLL